MSTRFDTDDYRVRPGKRVNLRDLPTEPEGDISKDEARAEFETVKRRLIELESLHFADGRHALLIVFQGMDTSGKDGVTRNVLGGVDPCGLRVVSFKAPSTLERSHDFLWRVHAQAPARGSITVFNRSHYEDVLIVRVNGLAPEKRWKARYEHINAFERMLSDEGTVIRKFFLHISKDYQREQLQERLDDPTKRWKFSPDDLPVRQRWDEYMTAYEDALEKCSTPAAPWYIVPAEKKWFRDLLVARVLVETLESLGMRYPEPTYDPAKIRIP